MADGHTLVLGAPWFEEWESYTGGILPVPTTHSNVAGGHDTEWADYDDTKGAFYCQNSWGPGWGIQGHFWVPYAAIDVFKAMGGYDAGYLTFNPLVVPIPPGPTPTPTPTTGIVKFLVSPPSAVISINGAKIPGQPSAIEIQPGKYVFKATLKGYRTEQLTVNVVAGKTYNVSFALSKSKLCIYN
jgi:hypothetical protein